MWNLRPEERLREWRQFRENIGTKDLESALKDTSRLWSYAPYVTHYLCADLPEEWPDPWTLVHENMYCDLAKSLGMFYTVYLCAHYTSMENLELRVYRHITTRDIVNTVWVNDGKYILNLVFDSVVNKTSVDENYELRYRYTVADLNLDLY